MIKLYFMLLLVSAILINCSDNKESDIKTDNIETAMSKEPHIVKVTEVIQTNDYTYLDVKENDKTFWIAVPKMEIENGETVYFSQSMEMKNFESPTLGRKFESVLFVQDAKKSSDPNKMMEAHSSVQNLGKKDIKIQPLNPDQTIAKLYERKNELAGKLIKIKGQVVKYNPNIMQRNWIHIQDGSGTSNDYDLVVTSGDAVKLGDIIIVEGNLSLDKDFGAGYFFPLIIENAKVLKGI